MCIVALALNAHPCYPLIVAANRDEFFSRPTLAASFWPDAPQVLAGRDLVAGGTWLGVTREGKIAAVTYFREWPHRATGLRSRGLLAADFLTGNLDTGEYLEKVLREREEYGPFNLLFGTFGDLRCVSNRGEAPVILADGVHAVSNGPLDSSWPKVAAAREGLTRSVAGDRVSPDRLFTLLAETEAFPDETLPDTGIGIDRERLLSPLFIKGEEYGTRSSTVILIGGDGTVSFVERTFFPAGGFNDVAHRFDFER